MSKPKKASDQLFTTHDELLTTLDRIFKDSPWEDPRFYAQWCGQFFYFVAHATRLLAASAARLDLTNDPLHIRFLDHCQEEKHHEQLFLNDLKALGYRIEDLPEFPMTAQLYQSQYYLIDYKDPIALFGSIFYLEGMSLTSGPEVYERVKKAHGDAATTFLRVHVSEDMDHIEKAKAALRQLSDRQLEIVEWSLKQTASIYEAIMKETLATYHRLENKKAA
ncbi:MAG: iron-containing redox enzyme family protein [Bdellovibrionaceae bacterium]|nr:iron-containing redox enzyme family protein [Pseudobdellovibrionaceae bacterium]MBX3033285.1 iron-containing redox enzyme family protein [Pseudobdellovibrionaceae bacterium]